MISVDAEWNTYKNAHGHIVGAGRVATIHLGFIREENGEAQALILQVRGKKKLPPRLLALFEDPAITITGRAIGGDLKRIGRNFNCLMEVLQVQKENRPVDLGPMARARDVLQSGVVTLKRLVEVTLGNRLSKDPLIRCSNQWTGKEPSAELQKYAALDAIVELEVYFELLKKT